MNVKIFILGIVLVTTLGVLVAASPAVAAPKSTTTTEIFKGEVNWVLSPSRCPDIQSELTGTGKHFLVITTKTKADGSQKIYYHDFSSGTASDTEGGTYNWIYTIQWRPQIPPSGSPIKVKATDTFLLSGDGAERLNIGFVWKWTYSPPDPDWPPSENLVQKITIGDPLNCDPL